MILVNPGLDLDLNSTCCVLNISSMVCNITTVTTLIKNSGKNKKNKNMTDMATCVYV